MIDLKGVIKTRTIAALMCGGLLVGCNTAQETADVKTHTFNSQRVEHDWWKIGREGLERRQSIVSDKHQAKNVILFIADGMGISTITAARIFDGQARGENGEENSLSFEEFPHVALVKTYNTDSQVGDSAGTASAMNTGVKTRIGAINIWADQLASDCSGSVLAFPRTIAELAEGVGMATGVVTTSTITDATPAAVYGHVASRDWQDDSRVPKDFLQKGCLDLAQQLVQFSPKEGIDVVLGGGKDVFLPVEDGGRRLDSQNLIEKWEASHPDGVFVSDARMLRSISPTDSKQVMGLFSMTEMSYEVDRDSRKEPSLEEMTSFAIDSLKNREQGYFLMVEGGRVDHAHHDTNAHRALSETQSFAAAIRAAIEKVDLDETLVLVTADHSHVFNISGYPDRGNPILGLVKPSGDKGDTEQRDGFNIDELGNPYTTLGYYTGPNNRLDSSEVLTQDMVQHPDYQQQSSVPLKYETHGGEDVALFAIGPQSHLFGGVIEQNVIFHLIVNALGWEFNEAP